MADICNVHIHLIGDLLDMSILKTMNTCMDKMYLFFIDTCIVGKCQSENSKRKFYEQLQYWKETYIKINYQAKT